MTGCARREEVFLEELDSDEENSNRKAGEESTAYESNVAAGENPEKQSAVSDAGSEGNTENSALDSPPETPIPQKIFVDVCGAVVNPGVYELDEGIQGSSVENPSGTVERDTGSFGDGAGDDPRINLNTADAGQLSTLSGIGQSKAEAIIAYREEHGDFASIEEIMNVEGIKEGTFSKIKDKISTG